MAEAIVGPLLSKLQEVVVKEAKALAAVGGEIDKLRDKLMWLQALVHEAELRSRHDGSRLVWVLAFQIRDAGFEVEDAVDQYYLQGSLTRRFGRHNWWRIAKELIFNLRTHFSVRAILSRRIRSVNVRLEEIVKSNSTYALNQSGTDGDGRTWRASRAIPPMRQDWDRDYSKEFVLKYRGEAREELMNQINKENVSKVITVVGVEGVGKSALLMHAYKQESIKKDFKACIWLSFPPDIGGESMFQLIQKQLVNKANSEDLKEVRCLVLIDSPVRTTAWHKVEGPLLEMVGKGSKILLSVTSSWREEKMKKGTNTKQSEEKIKQGTFIKQGPINPDDRKEATHGTIELRPMDEAHSIKLFNHIYGLERDDKLTDYQVAEMNLIRSNFNEITDGLPLAVVLLAKLMRTVDFGKWKAASDYLRCNSEDNKLKTILAVCVDDLSDELKSCLLYTAGFPDNRPIDARQLVRLWMAEGFLTQHHKLLEREHLGQCYLKELVYRGLLQVITKTSSGHGGGHLQWVAIPDQIHPLLRSEAQRTSFMHVHYGGCLPPPGSTRRLALHNYNNKFPALENCLDKLRTVVSYSDDYTDYPYGEWNPNAREHGITILGGHRQEKSSNDEPAESQHAGPKQEKSRRKDNNEPQLGTWEFLHGSPYLRVINLEGIQVLKEKKKDHVCALPDEIGEMVHLQYLGVRSRGLKKVPSSVGNLRNLQTIDVRGTDVRKLPKSLWKIKTLRHVLGDELALPRSTGDLKLMHTLGTVTIDQVKRGKEFGIGFLHRLHVAKLDVAGQGEALKSVLVGLGSLEALILSGNHIPVDLFAAAAPASEEGTASSCLKHVEYLKLDGQLYHPNQQNLDYSRCHHSCLQDLTHLVLRSTNMRQDFINWIRKLPVLAELELLEGSYEGEEMMFCAQEADQMIFFHCLTKLKISGLSTLMKIYVPGASTRRNKRDINTDVPDHVQVVRVEPRKQQQPGSAAGSDGQQQQAKGDEDDLTSNDRSSLSQTTTTDGRQPMKDASPLPDNKPRRIVTKIILEAVNENNSSITSITNYMKEKYVAKCLEDLVQSGKLRKEKTNNGRYNKYVQNMNVQGSSNNDQPSQGEHDNSPPEKGEDDKKTTEDEERREIITKIIWDAIDKNNSSITSITNYIKDTYVAESLYHMLQSGELIKENTTNGRHNKYILGRTNQASSSNDQPSQGDDMTK